MCARPDGAEGQVKIDIFNHVMPARYLELMKQHSPMFIREGIRSIEDLPAD